MNPPTKSKTDLPPSPGLKADTGDGACESASETEQHLRDERERLTLVLRATNDGIWDWDLRTDEVFFSDRWKEILGYAPDEISPRVDEWKSRVHPDDFDHVMAAHRDHFEGKTSSVSVEYRLRHKDGSFRWILGRGVCLRDADGVPYRAAGSHIDITERKKTDEALRKSESRMKAILSAIPDLIFRIDREGTLLDCHAASRDLLFLPPEEFLGKKIGAVLPGEIAEESLRHIAETLRGGELSPIQEYRLAVGDGPRDFEARFAKSGSDEVIAIVRDITPRKRAEEALRRNEEQLRILHKYKALGRMAGGLAHHLNNLMTVVTGYSELLLSRMAESDPRRQDIESIRSAGERAAGIVRELLAFGRQQILRPKEIDLNALIGSISGALRDLAGPAVRYSVHPGAEAGTVRLDPGLFRQALSELVSNARNAMPGGGDLTVSTSAFATTGVIEGVTAVPGPYACVTMADTGCGMDEETRARIFEPFFTTRLGNEGMGLASVYGFVKQSGGYLFVESATGRGTTVRIYFPRG